jgi:enolase-phosphatase E1
MQLLDIEGTVCPIGFVHETLFPYAFARLPEWVDARRDDPEVAAALARVTALSGAVAPRDLLATLRSWMVADAKLEPLKTLQGLVWADGWARGELIAPFYPDVRTALEAWAAAGERVCVYSSGSVRAQRDVFGHTTAGDLRRYVAGWYDTRVGAKRDVASYLKIASAVAVAPDAVVFWSDVSAELDAARAAGMGTRLVVREGPVPRSEHPVVEALS